MSGTAQEAEVAVSLVISTRDRQQALARCLQALERAAMPRAWEVVVVDNGSRDGTSAVIAAFRDRAPFRVVPVLEPQPGLSRARNRGVAAARGRIVAFTDDDCYIAPDYPERLQAAFRDPALGYLTGRVVRHDPRLAHTAVNERPRAYELPPHGYVRTGRVLGANMAFRREVLEAIGGFDPDFGSGTGFPAEDCEAAARASAAGWAGRYLPDVVVRHDHGRSPAEADATRAAYDLGRGAYHMKLVSRPGTRRAGLRGWGELPYRVLRRPGTLRGELLGAWRWWRAARAAR